MLPDKLIIGGMTYTIVEETEIMEAKNLWGETDHGKMTITLSPKMVEEGKLQTLVHEMVHGMIREAGLGEKYQAHKFLTPFAHMLYQTLKNNDFSFLREKRIVGK